MTVFVYKLIRQARLFCNYCFVLYCIVFVLFLIINFKAYFTLGHINLFNPLFCEEKNIKNELLIQGLTVAKQPV